MLQFDVFVLPISSQASCVPQGSPLKYVIKVSALMLSAMMSYETMNLRYPFKGDRSHVAMTLNHLSQIIYTMVYSEIQRQGAY